jgi:5-hydroxyisourate hydrolase
VSPPTAALTTHALDIMHGRPAAGLRVDFFRWQAEEYRPSRTLLTNRHGRTDEPFLDGASMARGRYQLLFHVGDYFAALGVVLPAPRFFDRVPVRFAIADPRTDYHVPILVAPWGYSSYRGA